MVDFGYIHEFEINDFHSANGSKSYLLTLGQKHFEISAKVYELIVLMKETDDLEVIAYHYSMRSKKSYSASDIENLIKNVIAPLWVNKERITPSKSFMFKKDLISSEALSKITWLLSRLFDMRYMLILSIVSILAILYSLSYIDLTDFNFGRVYNVPTALALYFFSIVLHELGHVSACRYYNIQHGSIGVAVYLYNPVFYADVTNCWRLTRFQRMKVNIGGMYFQLIYCSFIIALAPIIGWNIAGYLVVFILLSFVINLNPFFKLDGYWIVSDLLGVPNLSRVSLNTVKYVFLRLFNKHNRSYEKQISEIPKANRIILFVYILISNLFFGFIFLYHLPKIRIRFFANYIDQSKIFFHSILQWYSAHTSLELTEVRNFLLKSLYAFFLLIIVGNLLKRFYSSAKDIKGSWFNQ